MLVSLVENEGLPCKIPKRLNAALPAGYDWGQHPSTLASIQTAREKGGIEYMREGGGDVGDRFRKKAKR